MKFRAVHKYGHEHEINNSNFSFSLISKPSSQQNENLKPRIFDFTRMEQFVSILI